MGANALGANTGRTTSVNSKLTAIGLVVACAASVSCSRHHAAGGAASAKAKTAAAPKASASAAPKASAAAPRASASAAPAASAAAAGQDNWVKYQAKEYGFSMQVPPGTKFEEKKFGGGWAGLTAKNGPATLIAVADKGAKASRGDIEKFGVKVTGIPGKGWKQIDQGKNVQGWIWYRTVEATAHNKMTIGVYGVGKTASYLLLLVTTPADYAKNTADYKRWSKSIRLD